MGTTLYYEDLILLPDQEISVSFLMGKVISALHLICIESEHAIGAVNIGLAFPRYSKEKRSLGNVVRLYAQNPDTLRNSSSDSRIRRLDDYIRKGEITPVPSAVQGYVQYRRMQFKENKARLIRRHAKRHDLDINQATKQYTDYKIPANDLPYVKLNSLSSQQSFRLYIDEVRLETKNDNTLVFSSYGLTKSGVLPYFS